MRKGPRDNKEFTEGIRLLQKEHKYDTTINLFSMAFGFSRISNRDDELAM
jgi:hypothetical protein